MNGETAAPNRPAGPASAAGAPAVMTPAFRLATRFFVVLASAAGAAAATASAVLSGALEEAPRETTLPLSAVVVGASTALWLYGALLAVLLVATNRRPTRLQGWLAAFGLAPLAMALFFFVVSVGVSGGTMRGYVVAAAILAAAAAARRLLAAIPEKLLLAFFLWLALLVWPVLWSDPANRAFSSALLELLRRSGVVV